MKLVIEPDALLLFLQQKIEQKDAFGLVEGICQLLRKSKPTQILSVLQLLKHTLLQDKALGEAVAKLLCDWLCSLRLYPLVISSGILSREGFGREMKTRIYERFNPSKILMTYVIFFISYLVTKMTFSGLTLSH